MTIKTIIKYLLPYGIVKYISQPPAPRKCPICNTEFDKFRSWHADYGEIEQKDVECPICYSHPRHRKLWLYLHKKTKFFKNIDAKFLHIAPEACYRGRFKEIFKNYLTADLYDSSVMVKMDITKIEYPDNSFDIIMANHILEHISDDNKAMSELYRVLKKGGIAILLVPINSNSEKTYEDWSITTPEGRLKAFGQDDHVRVYGLDYFEKLEAVGFNIKKSKGSDFLSEKELLKYSGENKHNDIMVYCKK